MKKDMKSVMPTKIGTTILNSLITIFTQHGENITPERAAIVLMMLKEKSSLIQSPEGRRLFQLAKSLIKNSAWDEIVFPKPKSPEDIYKEKVIKKLEDHYFQRKDLIEDILNDVLFNE